MTSQYEELKHVKKAREQDQYSHADQIQSLQKKVEVNIGELIKYHNLKKEFEIQ